MYCDVTLIINFFFFNDTATTEIYTLSLHDALPISEERVGEPVVHQVVGLVVVLHERDAQVLHLEWRGLLDRKSTRLNSSHANISYAVFCLKKKNKDNTTPSDIRPRTVTAPPLHITC